MIQAASVAVFNFFKLTAQIDIPPVMDTSLVPESQMEYIGLE
jgi:hypothetical protein